MQVLFMVCFWLIAVCIVFIIVNCVADKRERKSLDVNFQMIILENKQAIDTLKNELEKTHRDFQKLQNFCYATNKNKVETKPTDKD